MSQYSRTTKKLPPEVYRRRRIAALLALVLVAGLVWAAVGAISSWLGGTPNSTALPEGMSESNVVVEAGQPCPPGTVVVEAQIGSQNGENKLSFGSDETPHMWFAITNTNGVDCSFNVGAKVQYFKIYSGEELIYNSLDCSREELQDANIKLKAAETISSSPQPWEKVYSSAGGCGSDQQPVIQDGASYHLKVEVNGELSSNSQQFVLN